MWWKFQFPIKFSISHKEIRHSAGNGRHFAGRGWPSTNRQSAGSANFEGAICGVLLYSDTKELDPQYYEMRSWKTISNLINCRYFNWPFFDLVSLCGLSLSSASFTRNSLTFPSSPDDSLHSTNEYSLCSLLSYRTTFWTSWTRSKQKKLEILMKR